MSETSDSEIAEKKDDDARKEINISEEDTEVDSLDNPETGEVDEASTDSSDLETPVETEDAATEDAEDNLEVASSDEVDEASTDSSDLETPVETEDAATEDAEDNLEVASSDEVDEASTDSSDLETPVETEDAATEDAEDNLEVASSDEVDEASTDSSDLETPVETEDAATDEAKDADDKPDKDDLSESQDPSQISEILESLGSVSEKVDKLSNPTSQQLNQAKTLILTLAGITGMVMIAAITFFIVMSISISQKVDELDRVLMAVAKRGIQLGDGIETIAEMDSKLIEVIEQNSPIPSSLSNIETQLITHGRTIIEKNENTKSSIKIQSNSILSGQDRIEKKLATEFDRLKKLINQSVDFDPLMKEHLELKNQVKSLSKTVTNVESKVQDLYVIKQAEMENAYRQLIGDD
jgi:hypothetical protein